MTVDGVELQNEVNYIKRKIDRIFNAVMFFGCIIIGLIIQSYYYLSTLIKELH